MASSMPLSAPRVTLFMSGSSTYSLLMRDTTSLNTPICLDAGARYLRDLLLKYDGLLWHALAAYNAGPEALEKYHNQIPPYRETILYIEKIDRDLKRSAGASQ